MTEIANTSAQSREEATRVFERVAGVSSVPTRVTQTGNREFLRFEVGREAPIYSFALLETEKAISPDNAFGGALGLQLIPPKNFPASLESRALLTLLTRSTKEVSEGAPKSSSFLVPYVPFQGREDHQLAQPATQIVRGRRGVGKSTLIGRTVQILSDTGALVSVLDMQAYSELTGDDLIAELLHDICDQLADAAGESPTSSELRAVGRDVLGGAITVAQAPVRIKRTLKKLTTTHHAFVFLDDFHLIAAQDQPHALHVIAGALKGANGWLKVAGLTARLHPYDPATRKGLQVPGDAQFIQLDLTLTDPDGAEQHLKRILEGFLHAVGYSLTTSVVPEAALRRLVWANAGVPRDFLQMFARALEHAQKNRRVSVTLSDVNMAIGEFGQQKMDELEMDARNDSGRLRDGLREIETFCLDENQTNAFLVRSEDADTRELVRALSDLRMVHLIHQSITPSHAGERYEAYIIDYSIFTGFRRRKNIKEMLPDEPQFKAAELRALPKFTRNEDAPAP